ncbi:phospholipase-like protein [Tanacetum coccineum]
MEYEVEMERHPWGYAQSYTRSLGSTTLGRSKVYENKHHLDKLKTNAYFPSLPPCFKPAQPLTKNTHEPLDPNDYDLCAPNSHHEDEKVSFDEDVDEWLNAEMGKRMTEKDKEEEEDALIDILIIVVEECKTIYKNAQIKAPSSRTSEVQGVSFVTEAEEGDSSETLLCQLPPKEINPRSFTLPCTIGNLKLYAMADLGARVNMMPKSLFEHLKLAYLKETSMVVEMADMTKKAPLGIVENILVKIDKFLFHSDFVVIDMLEGPNETMLLGEEKVKFNMNGGICHSRVPFEKIYMASSVQESKYFNPLEIETDVFSYDSPACLLFEQSTHPCSDVSIDTIDSSDNMQELKGSQEDEVVSHLLENVVSRWHVCKPVCITIKDCEKDCGKWPTCNPDLSFCSGYDAIYGKEESGMLKYGNKNIDDVTREQRYYGWVAQHYDFNVKSQKATKYADPYDFHHEYPDLCIPHESDSPPNDTLRINTYFPDVFQTQLKKLHLRDNSFEEWVKIKLEHTNISEAIKYEMFKEWVKENFNFEVVFGKTLDDPYSRRFDVYKEKYNSEIEQLANEYDLRVGMKKYAWMIYGRNVKGFRIPYANGKMKGLRKKNSGKIATAKRVSTVRRIKMKIVYQDYLRDKNEKVCLDDIWEKCERFQDTVCQWHDEGFEEEEQWESVLGSKGFMMILELILLSAAGIKVNAAGYNC